jgi:hypothetical protein
MKVYYYLFISLCFCVMSIHSNTNTVFAQNKVKTIVATDTTKPILPSDTVKRIGNTFTAMQDTIYQRALRMRISANSRFWNDIRLYGRFSKLPTNEDLTYAEILNRNMQIPAEFYLPNPQEVALNQYAINQSTFVPGLLQHRNPGMQIAISDILSIFGLTEDVSSVVRYQLLEPCFVEIVVYSMQAKVIRTILQAEQAIGTYEVTWNGKNDAGVRMPLGDYVSEVRLLQCNGRIFRKRIVLP